MAWTDAAASLGAQAATTGLKAAKMHMSKRRYKRLVATAVAEMLRQLPGVGRRKARRRARQATGARPSKKLLKTLKQVGWKEGTQTAVAAAGAAGVAKVVGAVTDKLTEGVSRRRRRPSQRQVAPSSGG